MSNRNANDTILGYFYQFDLSIEKILELRNDADSIVVEGVEDIDVNTATEKTAIQCKYYSKTEYNHSIIAKPIRFMLSHYKTLKNDNKPFIKYLIYGKYQSGQDKLPLSIERVFLKEHFLTYTENKVKRYHHIELDLSDTDLDNFISCLVININAKQYDEQLQNIIALLQTIFSCSDFEAEHYYYNNALKVIKNLAIQEDEKNRLIRKKDFLSQINKKEILFNSWFIKLKGKQKHLKEIKKQYFTLGLNTSPFERFFLIEIEEGNYDRAELKTLLLGIQKKWSKLSRRESQPFCPYIYLHGVATESLVDIKTCLRDEGYPCVDGFDFYGASYEAKSIIIQANYHNNIKLKIVNDISHIESALSVIARTKEVYQFYIKKPFFNPVGFNERHVKIQVENLKDIEEIVK